MADELLEVEFTEYPGEIITLRLSGIPMRGYFGVLRAWDAANDTDTWEALMRLFGDTGCVASWTFPEAPNGDGMLARDFKLGMAIVGQWIRGVRSVPPPLPQRRSAGTPSESAASPSSSASPS